MALSIKTKSSTFQCKISPCLIAGEKLARLNVHVVVMSEVKEQSICTCLLQVSLLFPECFLFLLPRRRILLEVLRKRNDQLVQGRKKATKKREAIF